MPLLAALALCAALNALAPRPVLAPELPVLSADGAVQSAGLLSMGMRRLAADVELVRLLVYYGTREEEQGHEGHDHGWGEAGYGGGAYPELGPRARRILALDPGFAYAVQYAAGALAFNLGRPDEALDLLALAVERDPKNLVLRSYAAAIGMSKTGDAKRALTLLEPALADPDCPTMIKSMAAFMHRRLGHKREAARLYLDILETSRDWGYRSTAERHLRELASGR